MTMEENLQLLIDYLCVQDAPEPADAIFIFGSILLPAVWERAAGLYHQGMAPLILTTGYAGPNARARGIASEGQYLADRLMELGVPSSAIIVEDKSSNTLENVLFGMNVLQGWGITVKKLLIVAKPLHMRRCAATFAKQFPDIRALSCPPSLTLEKMIDRPTLNDFAQRVASEIEKLGRYAGPNGSIQASDIPQTVKQAAADVRQAIAN